MSNFLSFLVLISSLTVGWRKDSLDWSIGVNDIDVLSELEYQNLDSIQVAGAIDFPLPDFWRCYLEGDFARIYHGRMRDSDYDRSGRQEEYSRARGRVDGTIFDLSAAVGSSWKRIGFSWNRQRLLARQLFQEVPFQSRSPIRGLARSTQQIG